MDNIRSLYLLYSLKFQIFIGSVLMLTGIWLSTGTLAPYANTLPDDGVMLYKYGTPCTRLYNCDHYQFKATFLMLNGAKRSEWVFSNALRRILFPLLAYPFMKYSSFEIGGVIAGALLNVLVFIFFILFIKKQYSENTAKLALWLLALYTGNKLLVRFTIFIYMYYSIYNFINYTFI